MLKILQLTKKFPSPLLDGEILAIYNLGRSLTEMGCEVSLLSMNTTRHLSLEHNPTELSHYHYVESVVVDNRIKIVDAFINLFSNRSYHIERFISTSYKQALIRLLNNNTYDIIQLETLYLVPYIQIIREHSSAKVVLRSHNIEHEIWQRIAANTSMYIKRIYLNLLTRRLKRFELNSLDDFDLLVPVTNRDLTFFVKQGLNKPSFVAPIGLDFTKYKKPRISNSGNRSLDHTSSVDFCFIGSLDWMPNIEGVEWLLEHVWPKIRSRHTNAIFHIAGRNAPNHLLNCELDGVVVHGEVDDAKQFIHENHVMLVPLFSGSGMRVKILEGMALGKTIISSSIGLEGIHATDKKEVLIANNPDEFIAQIDFCMKHSAERIQIGRDASTFIQDHFNTHQIARRLVDVYQELIS